MTTNVGDGKGISPGTNDGPEKRVIQLLRDTLDLNKHLHTIGNNKSSAILVVSGLLVTAVVTVCKELKKLDDIYVLVGMFILFLSVGSAVLTIGIAIFPRAGQFDRKNLLYFHDYIGSKMNKVEYKIAIERMINYDEIVELYATEIFAYGKTLEKEYAWQRRALAILGVSIPGVLLILWGILR